MKAVVLLSAGLHPVSLRPALPRTEAQAIRLALELDPGGSLAGLHVGPDAATVSQAFGHGLPRLIHIAAAEGTDPVAEIVAALADDTPDLILAGPSTQGGDETGLVPYAIAEALGLPIIAGAVSLCPGPVAGQLVIDQARPRGARRRFTVAGPVVITLSPRAAPPLPFAHARIAAGIVERKPARTSPVAERATLTETPHRHRPRLIVKADGSGEHRLLVDPTPEAAARAILDHLAAIGHGPER